MLLGRSFVLRLIREPLVNRGTQETPVLADLLPGQFAFLGELVKRRFGDLQVGRQFVDRQHFVIVCFHGDAIISGA